MTHCTSLSIHHTALHHASQVLREAYDTYERSGNEVEKCEIAWNAFVEARDAYHAFIEEVEVKVDGVEEVKTLTHRGAMLVERVKGLVRDAKFEWNGGMMVGAYFRTATALSEQLYVAISLLPDDISEIDCTFNSTLTTLPELPNGITNLYCNYTNLSALPELPGNIIMLSCRHSMLTSLPNLPDGLTLLACDHTEITTLPKLPGGLTKIYCNNTNLTSLPELPNGLTFLDCNNTPASKDPEIISRLKAFQETHPNAIIEY